MDNSIERFSNGFNRVSKLLSYIHSHLHLPLGLDELAQQSCWSRWQLQRVFQAETGLSVASYVRELKLSSAAEQLLDTSERVIDIGLSLGFSSEISFSRSFKQKFGMSPRAYRKLGLRTGLRKPIENPAERNCALVASFVEVRVESKSGFLLKGIHDEIHGLFSITPDFQQKVPQLWRKLEEAVASSTSERLPAMGVIDVTHSHFDGSNIHYWAGVELGEMPLYPQLPSLISDQLDTLSVPSQTYAVIKHKGPVANLPKTLEWFVIHWLPNSGYRGVDGFELECYPAQYDHLSDEAEMEYWVPIADSL